MPLQNHLKNLQQTNKAILAVNFYNNETLRGILEAAAKQNTAIILQLSESSLKYLGTKVAVGMARAALKHYGVKGWLHLDHADKFELVQECLDEGFDSVMIDASEKPIEENIALTKKVIKSAEKYGANVEAELGYIAKLNQNQNNTFFTDPEDAKYFVEETGVNALAIAIGNAHGFYKGEPNLDLERLSNIRAITDAILVLHGSSGIPEKTILDAIDNGITKINLATEVKKCFMQSLKNEINHTDNIDMRIVFPPAITSVRDLIEQKLCVLS